MCMLTKEFVLGFLRVKEESPRVKLGQAEARRDLFCQRAEFHVIGFMLLTY